MCTLIISNKPNYNYPFIVAANRDEYKTRKYLRPKRHWLDYPYIIAGKDCSSGGSWLGINDYKIFAAIVNKTQTLNNHKLGKSRGEIVLNVLTCKKISDALAYLKNLNLKRHNDFYLVVSDALNSYFISSINNKLEIIELPKGINVVTPNGLNNPLCPRFIENIKKIRCAKLPNPENNQWNAWMEILSFYNENYKKSIRVLDSGNGYMTLSNSLISMNSNSIKFLFKDSLSKYNGYESIL